MRISRAVLAVLAIMLVLATSITYRHEQIPASVEVAAKLRLWRGPSYGSGSLTDVILTPARDGKAPFDNVTLSSAENSNLTSTIHWRLLVVANESASGSFRWEHDVLMGSGKVGIYEGVVSTSLDLKGTFTLWVVLYSIRDNSILNLSSFSERIQTY
jgi:hypothetical protein